MKTKIYIIVLTLLSITLSVKAQNNYLWLHGLNDNSYFWSIYHNAFTPSNGFLPNFSSDSTITYISQRVWNANRHRVNNNTIIIGQSMGGLIAREIERSNPNSIKGIITFGTPHNGAAVLREMKDGMAISLSLKIIDKAYEAIRASIVALEIGIPFRYSMSDGSKEFLKDIEKIPSLVRDSMNAFFEKNYHPSIKRDMSPGSSFLNTLAQRKISAPILTFATEEDRWQAARMGYCFNNYSSLKTNPNINSNGDFDMGGYNQLKKANNYVKLGGHAHSALAVTQGLFLFWYPRYWVAAAANGIAANKYYSLANYIDNGLDYDHSILIGAYRVDEIPHNHKFLWKRWTTYTYVTVAEAHDGVVPVKSQLLDKSLGNNVMWGNQVIKGVNHMEQGNHPNTKAELRKVLDGTGSYNSLFSK